MKKVPHPNLNSILTELTIKEENKEISKNVIMTEQFIKRKIALKEKKILKKLKINI